MHVFSLALNIPANNASTFHNNKQALTATATFTNGNTQELGCLLLIGKIVAQGSTVIYTQYLSCHSHREMISKSQRICYVKILFLFIFATINALLNHIAYSYTFFLQGGIMWYDFLWFFGLNYNISIRNRTQKHLKTAIFRRFKA